MPCKWQRGHDGDRQSLPLYWCTRYEGHRFRKPCEAPLWCYQEAEAKEEEK